MKQNFYYVACDQNGRVHKYSQLPTRISDEGCWVMVGESSISFAEYHEDVTDKFPNVKWEDEPVRINEDYYINTAGYDFKD